MKKLLSVILCLTMMFSLSATGFAASATPNLNEVSQTYGIPVEVLETLDQPMLQSLINDMTNYDVVSSESKYIKIITNNKTETSRTIEGSYEQYISEIMSPIPFISDTDESSGWLRIHTTVIDKNNTTGQASCAFTWLTPPSPRQTDVMGLALTQGTFVHNSANGFYTHTSPNKDRTINYSSRSFDQEGHSINCKVKLELSDYLSEANDFMFLRSDFYKEGNSEGVNGVYGHKKWGLSINPSFSLSRAGVFSISGGFEFVDYYQQEKGYVSIHW